MKNFLKILKAMGLSLIKKSRHEFAIYFGVPGSGKTTFAAWLSKKRTKRGGRVYSNVPIKGTYSIDAVRDIGKHEIRDGTLIIDEAGIEYNNRKFKTFSDEATYFYKFHRHYKMDVFVFSQGFDDMDKKLRILATSLYVVRKSLIPFMVYRYRISKKVGINELTKEICDEYFKVPFSRKYIFTPLLWSSFDSYAVKELPRVKFPLWDEAV